MTDGHPGSAHPERKEITRYLLSRGLDPIEQTPNSEWIADMVAATATPSFAFPAGLTPTPAPLDPPPSADDPLPHADVVASTWTVDELVGFARVLTRPDPLESMA